MSRSFLPRRHRALQPAALASALGALVVLTAAPAGAVCNDQYCYCRSTTCSGDGCPRDDNGCKTAGSPLSWATGAVGYSIQKDGTSNLPLKTVRHVIEAAFFTWTEVPCPSGGSATMTFSELDDATCHKTEYNADGPNANIIMFQDTKWIYKGMDNTLAKTTVSFDPDSGEILDADIEINFAYNNFTVADSPPCHDQIKTNCVDYDLQSVLTHEIGHFIGLDHSPTLDATMYAGYNEGDTSLRTLAIDDIAGVCAIYPPGRKVKYDPTPHGGLSLECSDVASQQDSGCSVARRAHAGERNGSAGAMAAALLGMLAERRRRRLRSRRSS